MKQYQARISRNPRVSARSRSIHSTLVLAALTLGTTAAAGAPVAAKDRAQIEAGQLRRAVTHLKGKPAGMRRVSPAFLDRVERALASGDLSSVVNTEGPILSLTPQLSVSLQSDYIRLAELGAALNAAEDPSNLARYYQLAYSFASRAVQMQLPSPSQLSSMNRPVSRAELDLLLYEISVLGTYYPFGIQLPPSQATCEAENGFEDGTDGAAGTCGSYAPNGLMRNVDFPLRDDLTCVRSQGRRGTCVAFGTTAAVETAVHVTNGNKVNLSEQHAYWYGEIGVGFSGRYSYGLNTLDYVLDVESSGYELKKERVWNYNPSLSMGAQSGNTYPNSCVGYFGEECTDYAFQSVENQILGFFVHPDPNPNAGAFSITQAVEIGTDTAGLDFAQWVLDAEIGLVVAVDVTASFRAPNADGYVTYTPNEAVLGGHAMHVAGWVPNADLPALAPTGSGGGYYVLKNSWGEAAGDCGYYYVPYDYLLDYGRSLTTVEVN